MLLERIADKLQAGVRLSRQDALDLYATPDLFGVMRLADEANRAKNHDRVFYNVNRHINPTNICVLSCKFCAYSRKPGEEGAYAFSIDEMVAKAGEAVDQGATEVHMVGGLHPRWKFSHYRDMIAAIHKAYPALHLKAFTVVELDWMAKKERRTIREILQELVAAGLGSLPGGGAEIFAPEIREQICDTKVPAELWLSTHKMAHELGLHSNCTMLYGHIERHEHRVDHMAMLRDLQDQTGGFNAFIPLAFQPFQNEMGIKRYTFGFDDLKTIAIGRLFLDNFKHVKAYWVMLGQDIAQLALMGGANDLDGTVVEEKISRMAGGRSGMVLSRSRLESMIRRAGRIPVERDTLYNPVRPQELDQIDAGRDAYTSGENVVDFGAASTAWREASTDHASASVSFVLKPKLSGHTRQEMTESLRATWEKAQSEGQAGKVDAVVLAIGQYKADELPDLVDVLRKVWALHDVCSGLPVIVSGLKNLWRIAQQEQVELSDVLNRLQEAGVSSIESSTEETETDLTHFELATIHRSIHAFGLPTVAKVELSASASGEPMWKTLRKRLAILNEVQQETGGLWGISVEVAQGAFVTPIDYLKAVAAVREFAPDVKHVITSLAAIPSLSAGTGLGAEKTHHASEKLGPICLLAGASDLGRLPIEEFDAEAVYDDIRSAGFLPTIRDSLQTIQTAQARAWRPFPSLRGMQPQVM